jgi:hypothetical protein
MLLRRGRIRQGAIGANVRRTQGGFGVHDAKAMRQRVSPPPLPAQPVPSIDVTALDPSADLGRFV